MKRYVFRKIRGKLVKIRVSEKQWKARRYFRTKKNLKKVNEIGANEVHVNLSKDLSLNETLAKNTPFYRKFERVKLRLESYLDRVREEGMALRKVPGNWWNEKTLIKPTDTFLKKSNIIHKKKYLKKPRGLSIRKPEETEKLVLKRRMRNSKRMPYGLDSYFSVNWDTLQASIGFKPTPKQSEMYKLVKGRRPNILEQKLYYKKRDSYKRGIYEMEKKRRTLKREAGESIMASRLTQMELEKYKKIPDSNSRKMKLLERNEMFQNMSLEKSLLERDYRLFIKKAKKDIMKVLGKRKKKS